MKNETKHTETPWNYKAPGFPTVFAEALNGWVVADCGVISSISDYSTCRANAEFIVRACNSHDELLEALEALVSHVLEYERVNHLHPNPGRKYCWDDTERAIAAIQKAKGDDNGNHRNVAFSGMPERRT